MFYKKGELMNQQLIQLIIFLVLVALGYWSGTIIERKHYDSIKIREQKFLNFPAVTFEKNLSKEVNIKEAKLVTGSVVISIDYFKRFLAGLRNLFGGEVTAYESLIDRARREAILRMKEMAGDANIIMNFRIETSTIGRRANKSLGSIEVLAYGTAITLHK